MLKALELVGFKSFADKTRLAFASGITAVVGPNGSGKSNVVDAIKWVLGEQSVKSLRGKEMADVIFNGSGTRRPMNAAEVTLTFDNSKGLLPIDAPEVHITRRVYRSGEGEYLINRQPSRLRDIRELLAGTGLGAQAYSVIEQGKVDSLLQSSAKDRRVIFEEAAGISRFKAKKVEALRRLERVEQNLLRLSDIVDEVDNRLRSVRNQAGKARRYKEYTDRLQELRTQVAQVDWRRLTEKLTAFQTEIQSFSTERDSAAAEAESLEARLLEIDVRVGDINEQIRASEAHVADNRERIAAQESTIEYERQRGRELDDQMARHRQQVAEMSSRADDLEQQLRRTSEAVETALEHHRQITQRLAEGERELTELIERLDQRRGENHDRRATYMEQMRLASALGNEISGLESQVASALASRERAEQRIGELDKQLATLAAERKQLYVTRDVLVAQVTQQNEQLTGAQGRVAERRQQSAARQVELAQFQQRRSGLVERIAVLEELEKRYEGVSPGVKEVLTLARNAPTGPFRPICGLVADLLRVSVESAQLIEIALGEKAQHVVVGPGEELIEYLKAHSTRLAGRVGFLWLDRAAEPTGQEVSLDGRPGVLGRADRFVETDPKYQPLARWLLGRTWIVQTLADAMTLAQVTGPRVDFVTLAGELLAADGVLTVGPRHASVGLISRRSELRALKSQLVELEARIEQLQTAIARLQEQIEQEEEHVGVLAGEHQAAVAAWSEHGHKITAAEERNSQLGRQRASLEQELTVADAQLQSASQRLDEARARQKGAQATLAEMERELATLAEQIDLLEADRQTRHRVATEVKVELAKSEERLGNLRAQMRQYEESQQERLRAIKEAQEQMAQCAQRGAQSQWSILRAESEVAELYLRKEAVAGQTIQLVNQREAIQQERSKLHSETQRLRVKVRKLEERIHAQELAATEVQHERNALADRLREDYGIELAQLENVPSDEEQHRREEVQQEIDELRRKINNLGNVNLEALEEIDQLEGRYKTLAEQYKDLTDAKTALVRIIDKINGDSRRLFSETMETVRGHFRGLFASLFGGGQADIVLEEGADILESGIEIVARPPGKELRSISLLSGGEKTMTCVALLLSLFRSRPSPFCLLDEVDAALDEANIDRFTKVIRDFLTWTQFIVITHSKKTMTCASTIYGVTMQESGVSKQVSVRFEDVSDNGEIRISAEHLADAAKADSDEEQAA
jgi:chromosome segregation protein